MKNVIKLFKRKGNFHYDRIAMQIAAMHGMTYEYKMARRNRLTPLEALEDWDLLQPNDYKLFCE